VRKAIARLAPERIDTPIIAKLERPEAVDNLEEIIHAADGVMVARGDLGVEMSPETVPVTQKRIIEAANQHAKLVITATQMLDSMIHSPRPTRAEATDVANAIFDGSDALMLSGETATGKYPLQAVRMMDAIISQAEKHLNQWSHWAGVPQETVKDDALALAHVARELAHDRDVAAIAVFTQTGRTARLMSKVRPRVPILAFTPEQRTYHRLAFYWGVIPNLVPFADSVEAMLAHVELPPSSPVSRWWSSQVFQWGPCDRPILLCCTLLGSRLNGRVSSSRECPGTATRREFQSAFSREIDNTRPKPINPPPRRNIGVSLSPKKRAPRAAPTTG
jgi:pyruvate kinase